MDSVAYKEFHENYMKNNNGTTIEDVFLTIIPIYFTSFLATNLIYVAYPLETLSVFLIEFIFIVFSTILHVTVLNYRIWEYALTLCGITVTAVIKQLYGRIHIAPFVQIPCKRPEYLNSFRACINLFTAICILAVDFKCFPKKHAKTETFGFGVMDTGVGLFVFGNGLVASELNKRQSNRKLTWKKVQSILWSCLPLFALGAVRFTATNELDYQQHISEYGVHWNFFLTLAFTKLFGTFIIGFGFSFEYLKYVALSLLFAHQLLLQLGGSDYVIDTNNVIKRDNFLNANREGICSITGYVSLYLASVYIGYILRFENSEDDAKANEETEKIPVFSNARQVLWKAGHLLIISAILWKITYILKNLIGVSRRLADMGYVFWILSIGTTLTALFMLLEIFHYFRAFDRPNDDDSDTNKEDSTSNRAYAPIILSAITYNGLAFFLLANVLTGAINLCIQTLLQDTLTAILILVAYMLLLCTIMTFLYIKQIKLKFW